MTATLKNPLLWLLLALCVAIPATQPPSSPDFGELVPHVLDSMEMATGSVTETFTWTIAEASTTADFWEDVPEARCQTLVNAGNTCGDGTLHCPTTVGEITTAIGAADAGDAICLRDETGGGPTGGIYECTNTTGTCFSITTDGTGDAANQRIHLGAYPGEYPEINGAGDINSWNDFTGQSPTGGNSATLVETEEVGGDYWTIQGIRFTECPRFCILINADYTDVYDNDFQYVWWFGHVTSAAGTGWDGNEVTRPRISWNRFRNSYHHSSIYMRPDPEDVIQRDTEIKYNILMDAGYEADGDPVPVIPGDPAGGGNADLIAFSVQCDGNGSEANKCLGADIRYNVALNAADDCVDVTVDDLTFWGNVLYRCAPEGRRGLKIKGATPGNTIVSNYAHGGPIETRNLGDQSGMAVGFELRSVGGFDAYNNGVGWAVASPTDTGKGYDGFNDTGTLANNLTHDSEDDFARWGTASTDWGELTDGDPGLVSCPQTMVYTTTQMDDETLTPLERLDYYYKIFAQSCGPDAGSSLIDAGTFVSGIHCPLADDNGQDTTDATCLHWLGAAPDIGPFERGLW